MSDVMNQWVEKSRKDRESEVLPSASEQREKEIEAQRDEDSLVDLSRENALLAVKAEREMIQRVSEITRTDQTPQALRALADARAKSVETLMKLTGRDVKPVNDDLPSIINGLVAKGLVRANVSLEIGQQDES